MSKWPILVIALVCVAARTGYGLLAPFQAFGYDFGFYLYAIDHAEWTGLIGWLSSAWVGYGNLLFPAVRALNASGEYFLIVSQLIFAASTAVACYYFWKKESRITSIGAALLYVLSVAQTELYLMFLWKNLFGLLFLILSLKFLRDRNWPWAITTFLLTLLTHRTSAIVLAGVWIVYGIYYLIQSRSYAWLLLSTVLALGIFGWLWPTVFGPLLLIEPDSAVAQGIFLSTEQYLLYSWPIVILGGWGFILLARREINLPLVALLIISALGILPFMPFHNRMWVYLDIALILYTAKWFQINPFPRYRYHIFAGVIILMTALQIGFAHTKQPLITEQEIAEIKTLQIDNPETLVIALDAADAPWLLGYLNNGRVAAPGLFENRHSEAEWQSFWEGKEQKIFFTRYPRPLMVYQRSHQPVPEVLECAPPVSKNFLNYECK